MRDLLVVLDRHFVVDAIGFVVVVIEILQNFLRKSWCAVSLSLGKVQDDMST